MPDFTRRASRHISIAYNIHFHSLNQRGLIKDSLSDLRRIGEFQFLDPTFPAKKIRERKSSDIIKHTGEPPK